MANNHQERVEPVLSLENMPALVEMPEPKWRATVIGLLHEGQERIKELDQRMEKFETSQGDMRADMAETHKLAMTIAEDTAQFREFLNNSKGAFKLFEQLVKGARWVVKWVLLPIVALTALWRISDGKQESTFLKALLEFFNQ